MPLKSTRSFSGKLLKRYRSKTRLNEDKIEETVPALPKHLPVLDIGSLNVNVPFAPSHSPSNIQYDTSPLPNPKIHRRSLSFSELLSVASNATGSTSDFAPAQPWRDRDAWAAIHSPTQGPIRTRHDGSVMDRSYGWMERDPERAQLQAGQRDVKGRDQFKFFHNGQNTSSTSLGENTRDIRYPVHANAHGRSRLNESTSTSSSHTAIPPPIGTETRPTSTDDSSSTISSMDLSTNPHTPPTSIDQHFITPPQPYAREPDTPRSATSVYSDDTDDLPLPPLLPHNVKRADSPPAFISRFPAQVPWAQRSTIKDIREASNLRWATGSGSNSPSPSPSPSHSPLKPTPVSQPIQPQPPRTPPPLHRRKRSMTAPSVFDQVIKQDSRPESGTLPAPIPSPPRPPRHPKRQTRAPPPIPIETVDMPVAALYNPPSSSSATPSSRDEWTTPLTSPMPLQSPVKGPSPSAYYKPTMPLRSIASAQSLRPGGGRRPSTAPTQGSPVVGRFTPMNETGYPTPPPSSTGRGFDRLSRNTSSSSATRGGWI